MTCGLYSLLDENAFEHTYCRDWMYCITGLTLATLVDVVRYNKGLSHSSRRCIRTWK